MSAHPTPAEGTPIATPDQPHAPSVPAVGGVREAWDRAHDTAATLHQYADSLTYEQIHAELMKLIASCDRHPEFAKLEQDLWALRQRVLGMGMGDPWDGEELENGYVRPIPAGFEDEVAKFDKMHSQQIKESNECLDVISELAMRCRTLAEAAPQPTAKQAEGVDLNRTRDGVGHETTYQPQHMWSDGEFENWINLGMRTMSKRNAVTRMTMFREINPGVATRYLKVSSVIEVCDLDAALRSSNPTDNNSAP